MKIHNTRVHGAPSSPERSAPPVDSAAAKMRLANIIGRGKVSVAINRLILAPQARHYGDESIMLSPDEASDIDGVFRELFSEISDTVDPTKYARYLPWVSLIVLIGPILLDKYGKISDAKAAGAPPKPPKTPAKPVSANELTLSGKPKLTRADVQSGWKGEGDGQDRSNIDE